MKYFLEGFVTMVASLFVIDLWRRTIQYVYI